MRIDLKCGDCLELMKEIPNKSIDAVITDPPYGIGVQNKNCVASRKDKRSDDFVFWDFDFRLSTYLQEIIRLSDNRIIWGANYHNCFENGGAIVWDKLQPLSDSSQCEIASISKYRKVFKYEQRWTNFVNTKTTSHPTEKPIELMLWILNKFTNEGDTILDPFMGSGTTGVACVNLNRNFIGFEINPDYFAIAKKRINNALAKQGKADLIVSDTVKMSPLFASL